MELYSKLFIQKWFTNKYLLIEKIIQVLKINDLGICYYCFSSLACGTQLWRLTAIAMKSVIFSQVRFCLNTFKILVLYTC